MVLWGMNDFGAAELVHEIRGFVFGFYIKEAQWAF
jgi:catalase